MYYVIETPHWKCTTTRAISFSDRPFVGWLVSQLVGSPAVFHSITSTTYLLRLPHLFPVRQISTMASRTVFARTALSARAGSALPSSARLAHPATGLFLAGAAPRSLAWNSLAARASARAGAPVGQSVRALHTSPVSLELLTRYTKDHEWITYDTESNVGTMGITDHAQNTLGDTTFIDLPSLGTEFEAGGA